MQPDVAQRLQESEALNAPLHSAYMLAEEWGVRREQPDGRRAWAFLRDWCAQATTSGIREVGAMAKTLLRRAKGIVAYDKAQLIVGRAAGAR